MLAAGAQFFRALLLLKVMTKYGKFSSKEHQIWLSVKKRQKKDRAVREAIKSKLRERGLQIGKLRCFPSEAWQQKFEVSKCAIPSLLPLSNNYRFNR